MGRIYISIEADLSWEPEIADLWPDGDEPAEVDADAIVALIDKCGGVRRVLRDWCLIDDLELHVVVHQSNPHWNGDQVLFGDPPPREIVTTARAT